MAEGDRSLGIQTVCIALIKVCDLEFEVKSRVTPGTEPIDMPLAAIVGIWVLLAPPVGGACDAAMYVAQAASSAQDSQSVPAQQPPAQSNSENKPSPEQNPPKAGTQEESAKPSQESQPSQTETPGTATKFGPTGKYATGS